MLLIIGGFTNSYLYIIYIYIHTYISYNYEDIMGIEIELGRVLELQGLSCHGDGDLVHFGGGKLDRFSILKRIVFGGGLILRTPNGDSMDIKTIWRNSPSIVNMFIQILVFGGTLHQ